MKTLNDMLQKATQLSKREMKNVKGGEGGSCGVNITCGNGLRVKSIRNLSREEAQQTRADFYNDSDALAIYGNKCGSSSVNAYWCCQSC